MNNAPMNDTPNAPTPDDRISIFGLIASVLERGYLIGAFALAGALFAVVPTYFSPSLYTSSAMVVSSQGPVGVSARLRGLAQSFGVGAAGSESIDPSSNPLLLIQLARSPVVLGRLAFDSLEVPELHEGRETAQDEGQAATRVALADVLMPARGNRARALDSLPAPQRARLVGARLTRAVEMRTVSETGALRLSVSTEWPSVSLHVAERLLDELNGFNAEISQQRASDERRFAEERVAEQERDLREAEAELGAFLEANRQFRNSPELSFEHDRLNRAVALEQQLLVSLMTSLDQVRLREVRDVPVLQTIEAPTRARRPDAKRRKYWAVVGLGLGAILGLVIGAVLTAIQRAREAGDPEVERMLAAAQRLIEPVTRRIGRARA